MVVGAGREQLRVDARCEVAVPQPVPRPFAPGRGPRAGESRGSLPATNASHPASPPVSRTFPAPPQPFWDPPPLLPHSHTIYSPLDPPDTAAMIATTFALGAPALARCAHASAVHFPAI